MMAAGLCSTVFVARCPADEATVRKRVDGLLDFYGPLGIDGVQLLRLPHLSLLVGELRFSPPPAGPPGAPPRAGWTDAEHAYLLWGGPSPAWLSPDELLTAGDHQLRSLDRTVAAFAADGVRARLVTGCAGAATLFSAGSAAVDAWSTHAVAAGFLAHGKVSVDPGALPELFAAEFVGAGRTHLRGVEAVPAATSIEFGQRAVSERSYWSARERFALLPGSAANDAAETGLLESLASKLARAGDIELGLTGGADSRLAAVALQRLGLDFQAVTIAAGPEAPDARGAARVAEALGARHRLYGYQLVADPDSTSLIDAEARWSEGLAPLTGLGLAESGAPAVFLTGGGGEVARAWYYRWQALNYRHPTPKQLHRTLAHLHWRIDAAAPEAHQRVDDAISAWIEAAQATGHSGWRTLDVVYESERLRRWGRARLPRVPAPVAYAFSSPDLTRALISLPLADRISDGFHRRFLAKHAPELALDRPRGQRRRVPIVARRLKSLVRQRRGLERASASPWFLKDVWQDRPLNRAFIADEALSCELLREAMGTAWVERVRTGFLAGEHQATQTASLATGVAALDRALESLR
jgi:hypothetical protein